eukprot:8697600-Pyramimonas_sp.AAC.1
MCIRDRLRPQVSQRTGSVAQLQAETEIGSSAERMVKRRMQARKADAEALADRRARLAAISKTRKSTTWETGELVSFRVEAGSRMGNAKKSK